MTGNESSAPAPSGVDLARVALQAARQRAQSQGSGPARRTPRRGVRAARTGGRDPIGFGSAVGGLLAERAWELPAAGGSVLQRWPQIAPELIGKVAAVGYDPKNGTLELCPASAAYGSHLRLLSQQIIRRINDAMGEPVVRALRVLQPGAVASAPTSPAHPAEAKEPAATAVRRTITRDQASAGYHQARAALQASRPEPAAEPPRPAVRQPALREPETDVKDGQAATLEDARSQTAAAQDAHARALARARAEKSGRLAQTVFQRSA